MDFGYILGRDPKPFPPPMKLCKEMVEAMGGAERFFPHSTKKKKKSMLILFQVLFFWITFDNYVHYHFMNDGLLVPCSQYYTRFKSYCCEAYNILRKSSNLILNLFHLMAGSNIPDIASDPEKGILKVPTFCICSLFLDMFIFFNMTRIVLVLISFKRNFGWTWTTRPAYTSSRTL